MQTMWNRTLGAALAAASLALAPAAALAGPTGNIQSNNIRDADGTTGQSTTTGSGVKTGHIQNGAVTAAKLATGAVGASALAAGAVGNAAIQDGAVTAAKLAGAIPASKIDRTGLDADTVDGYQAGDFSPIMHNHVLSEILGSETLARKSRNVIIVAKDAPAGVPGYFNDPAAALDAIQDAGPANPYLVRVAPGDYAMAARVAMKPYIDLEGSGEGITTLTWTTASLSLYPGIELAAASTVRALTVVAPAWYQTLHLADTSGTSRVEQITIRVTPAEGMGTAVGFENGASMVLKHVTIVANVGGNTCYGIYGGDFAHLVVDDVDVDCSGNASALALYGGQFSDVSISNSRFRASSLTWANGVAAVAGVNGGSFRMVGSRVTAAQAGDCSIPTYPCTAQSHALGIAYFQPGKIVITGNEITAKGTGPGAKVSAVSVTDGFVGLANSVIDGAITRDYEGFGTFRCVGLVDSNFLPVNCPQ